VRSVVDVAMLLCNDKSLFIWQLLGDRCSWRWPFQKESVFGAFGLFVVLGYEILSQVTIMMALANCDFFFCSLGYVGGLRASSQCMTPSTPQVLLPLCNSELGSKIPTFQLDKASAQNRYKSKKQKRKLEAAETAIAYDGVESLI